MLSPKCEVAGAFRKSPEKAGGQQGGPEAKASVVSWAIFGAALVRSRNEATPSSDEVADQVLSVIAGGLRF